MSIENKEILFRNMPSTQNTIFSNKLHFIASPSIGQEIQEKFKKGYSNNCLIKKKFPLNVNCTAINFNENTQHNETVI